MPSAIATQEGFRAGENFTWTTSGRDNKAHKSDKPWYIETNLKAKSSEGELWHRHGTTHKSVLKGSENKKDPRPSKGDT